jgi:AcrR family transcriptional regulator
MGIAERRSREKEELRSRIMDAATELFVKEGFSSVSMRKIAEKIEYAPSTIYLYFEDKNKLMATIVEDTFHQLSALLQENKERNLAPIDGLFAGIRIYIKFGLEHPNHYYLAFCTLPDLNVPSAECKGIQEAGLRALQHLAEALGACMEVGAIARQDITVLTQTVWTLMHGITAALIFKDHDPDFPWAETDQIVEKGVEILRQGILRPVPSLN